MSTPPTNYDRQYNFENFQTLNPTTPLPGQEIEAELNNIELSVNQTILRLNELQNSDGSLKIGSSLSAQTVSVATATATSVAEATTEAYLTANYDPTIATQAAASASAAQNSATNSANLEDLASTHANYSEQYAITSQTQASLASASRVQARDYAIDANDSRNEALASEQSAAAHLAETNAVYISALQLKNNVDSQSNKFLNKREELHHAAANMLFNGGDISSDMISKVFSGTSFNSNSQLQTSGTIDAEYENIENGLWWVEGHPEPEHPALIISRDMGVVLANTWKVFGPNAVVFGPDAYTTALKDNNPGINGCPSPDWHLDGYETIPLIKSVNFSTAGYGIDRTMHKLGMQMSALTPVAYVNSEDNKVRDDITALANSSALIYAPIASPTFTGTVTIPSGASIYGFALLESPTFTGTPTLPTGTIAVTQTAGNSTTALATTAFVTTANNLKANLASPTFTGTVTIPSGASISGFALLASPTFTGDPKSVTPATSDNDTSIATTAFVKAQGYATNAAISAASFLTTSAAATTYQTLSGMSSYLDTATAASTYYLQTNPSDFISSATAASTYYLQTNPSGFISDAPSDGSQYARLSGAWAVVTGGGGGSYLPLAGGTMTGAITFDATGLQNINKGTFDNSTGGYNGISLICAVGYELNWQGGHLGNWYSGAFQTIYADSAIEITHADGLSLNDPIAGFPATLTGASFGFAGGLLISIEEAHIDGFNINLPASGTITSCSAISNSTNVDLQISVYNDTGAGTTFVHTFDTFTGTFKLATNGGGLTFPDGTTQVTATVTGPAGTNGTNGASGAMNYLDIVTMTSSAASLYVSGGSWSAGYGFMNTGGGWFYNLLNASGVTFKFYINGVYDSSVVGAYNYYSASTSYVTTPVTNDVLTVFISDGTNDATIPLATTIY